ncbi:probable long-chain-alcohol O-fatty-acyltransferase 5 [Syzygium oleosum]|uniref:probable long-chain-alcohol O-fatty-acyltransferase 5 n=1 Tax=Syzygium oleosum TaxID=219896 RepID=UPI0011D2A867|nr:probable long-chain-alcohol O-fatty-acyltransferase 5 [Syzygium oleosum]XP_056173237.1 probable long-chain-alcohol O-fatty-acyltransferase 5 [Syzygium oleosum]XP_056173238.1 probable long-chain-alcohol O-fatty-acyltransferase 5 [Syzygium oleosum]
MEEEARNFINVWLTVLACVGYCYFVSSKLPPGRLRLFSLLPVFSLFAALPLRLSTVLPTGVTAFFVTWLASFKLLLFSFDRGPLSSVPGSHPDPSKSLFLFILFACFPVKIRQAQDYPSPQTPKLPLNFPSKLLLFGTSILVHDHRDKLLLQAHPKLVLLLYSCMLYLFVDMIMGLSNAAARAVLGVELQMPSDEPYLSTSLQDFWGRRWNLTVTNALRHTVYRPLKSFLEPRLGATWPAAAAAVMAAFLVSGLMHELLYYYMVRARPTWEVTGFFVLQGACVVVEVVAKWAAGERWRLSRAVATPLTVGFVAATAMWLFFPQLIRNGADVRAIKECKALVQLLKPKF